MCFGRFCHSSLILVISIIDWFTALITISITSSCVCGRIVQYVYLIASSCVFKFILINYLASEIVSLHIRGVLNGSEFAMIFTRVVHCDDSLVAIQFVKFRVCSNLILSTW